MESFISWIGGKKLLKKEIIKQFPDQSDRIDRYIEVFGGAGWVLFGKNQHAKMEVFNDINSDLINLYKCVKYHPEALQRELEWVFMSREQFLDSLAQNAIRGMTDIQRAARFYCKIKLSFGTDLRSFGVKSRNMKKTIDYIREISKRLNAVIIENVDFERLIRVYDRPTALFYLDPPYYKAEKYYDDSFEWSDHVRLYEALSKIEGKFILSYNDNEALRDMYKEYTIVEVQRANNLAHKKGGELYKELIIKNF